MPVVKTPDGNYMLKSRDGLQRCSNDEALKCASKYCEKLQKQTVLISEETEYFGYLNEGFNKVLQAADRSTSESTSNDAAVVMNVIANDNYYETVVIFRCE